MTCSINRAGISLPHDFKVIARVPPVIEVLAQPALPTVVWPVTIGLPLIHAHLPPIAGKGIREIATPIRWRDQHIATLYAGTWRSQQAPPEAMALGQEWIYTWHELPLWSDRYQAQWGPLLKLFASGLAEELAPIIFNTAKSTDMQTRIDSWVQLHFSREVTLNDLAEFLGRSASRTSALVRSLYGQPFALVLRSKRLKVAAHYLQTTTKRIRSIAHSAGFNDPAYFSRIFRQKYGVSPKQWRQRYDHQDDA